MSTARRERPHQDAGYAWVVLAICFVYNALNASAFMSTAVYLMAWSQSYDINKAELGAVGALMAGIAVLSGIIVGPLIARFGCRPPALVGALVTSLGLLTSALVPAFSWLFATYGVITGVGCGLVGMPPLVYIQYYFRRRRPLALGTSMAGHSAGILVAIPLLQWTVERMGATSTLILHAGLTMQMLVLACLFRPVLVPEESEDAAHLETRDPVAQHKMEPVVEHGNSVPRKHSSLRHVSDVIEVPGKHNPPEDTHASYTSHASTLCTSINKQPLPASVPLIVGTPILPPRTLLSTSVPTSDDIVASRQIISRQPSIDPSCMPEGISRQPSVDPSRRPEGVSRMTSVDPSQVSIRDLFRLQRQVSVISSVSGVTVMTSQLQLNQPPVEACVEKAVVESGEGEGGCLAGACAVFSCSLLRVRAFPIYILAVLLVEFGLSLIYRFTPIRAAQAGLSDQRAALLITVIETASLAMRITGSVVITHPRVNRPLFCACAVLGLSVLTCVSGAVPTDFRSFALCSAALGICIGLYFSSLLTVLTDILGVRYVAQGLSLLNAYTCIATFLALPIAGRMIDVTGRYSLPFYVYSALMAVGAILFAFIATPKLRRKTSGEGF